MNEECEECFSEECTCDYTDEDLECGLDYNDEYIGLDEYTA